MNCPKCKAENPADAIYCGECQAKIQDIGWELTADDTVPPKPAPIGSSVKLLDVGTIFAGRYEIRAVVGEGGMGVVYRALDRVVKKEVALKLVRAERLAGVNAVERLIREGVTARDIRHSNVVAVYDVGEVDGQPYLSMEYLQGKSLYAWNHERTLARRECSMKTASRIIEQILQGLEAAHSAGVVHRDLKPENVMLLSEPNDQEARLKILDFGVARAGGSGDTGSTTTGTIGYMAPEQKRAPDAADPPADLYSLSVIFYELLVDAHPDGVWEPPSRGRRDVPLGIDALILRGLSKRPGSRPQDVAEYARELAKAQTAGGLTLGKTFKQWLEENGWDLTIPGGAGVLSVPKPPAPTETGNRTLWQWFMYGFAKRYADGAGRAHRKEFWGFMLGALALLVAGVGIDIAAFGEYEVTQGMAPFTVLTLLVLLAPSIAVTSRRLHDLGYSGWLALATTVPVFGLVIGFPRGTAGPNDYGADPLMQVAA